MYITTEGKARSQDKFQLTSEEHIKIFDYNNPPEQYKQMILQNKKQNYNYAVQSYREPIMDHLLLYKQRGLKTQVDSKALFKLLSRYNFFYGVDEAVDLVLNDADSLSAGKGEKDTRLIFTIKNNALSIAMR